MSFLPPARGPWEDVGRHHCMLAPGQGQRDSRSLGRGEKLHGRSVKSDEWTCPGGQWGQTIQLFYFLASLSGMEMIWEETHAMES